MMSLNGGNTFSMYITTMATHLASTRPAELDYLAKEAVTSYHHPCRRLYNKH